METKPHSPYRVFLAYLLLTFYCFGAGMMNEFVEYLSYADLGRYVSSADFARWHQATSQNVLPILLGNIALLALFINQPASIPKRMLWVVLACALTAWSLASCFQVMIEWQTDWIRETAFFIEIGVVIFMAVCFFRSRTIRLTISEATLLTP